ncbi:MAG TPA: TonB-dependent receptor [Bryobacteraceae bacterium]|nr:TonB-dependent receptor [Bryobacteraceae bacterium]
MRTVCLFLLLALSTEHSVLRAAQGASLSGVVRDPQGRAVAGASLSLFSRTASVSVNTVSDYSGSYHFDGLAPGDYILRAEAAGFATFFEENLQLTADTPKSMDVALQLSGIHEEVVVTASSTPQVPEEVSKSMTVIDHTEIDDRDKLTLADAVNLAPSLRVQQLGGPGAFTTIQIRGLRTEDTAVLVDGIRLRDSSSTQGDAAGLIEDLFVTDTNRVEILRGSGSSLYGTNAIGGVINVITDEGGGRTRGSVLTEGGSLGMFRGRAQLSGSLNGDQIPYSFGASQTYVGNGVNGDDPYRSTSIQGRAMFHLSPSTRLVVRVFGGDAFGKLNSEPGAIGEPPASGIVNAIPLAPSLLRLYDQGTPISQLNTGNATFIPAPDNPDYTRAGRFFSGALILTGQLSPRLDYSISYQVLANSRRYGDGPAGVGFQPDGSTRSLYDGRIQTVNAHVDYRLGRHNLVSAGYEFESETYANDNAMANDPTASSAVNVTELSHTVFVQDQANFLGDRLQISGAVRAQYFTLDRPSFAPAASAPYQGVSFGAPPPAYTADGSIAYSFRKSGTKLRAHVGRGYREPSLFERFGAGFDPTFGYSVYGDPHLTPEHSIGLDAGVDQRFLGNRLKLSASYFYTWLRNVIVFDTSGLINPSTDPFGRFVGYVNEQGGIARGVELSATASPTRSLNISAAYTYVNALERSPLVGDVIRTFAIPRNQFSFLATQRVKSRLVLTFDLLASSDYLEPIFGDVSTAVYRFGGIHKAGVGGSYRLPLSEHQAIRFFVRADNIFNQNYFEDGFPTPGRTGMGGMQFEF